MHAIFENWGGGGGAGRAAKHIEPSPGESWLQIRDMSNKYYLINNYIKCKSQILLIL
jgi:hypothetical protein